MAVSNADRRAVIIALLSAYGEGGLYSIAAMMHYLTTGFPGIAWETELRAQAATWQPFIDSRLSIPAWCDEVMRQADLVS